MIVDIPLARFLLCFLLTVSSSSNASILSPFKTAIPTFSSWFLPHAFIAVENSEPSLRKLVLSSFKNVYESPIINWYAKKIEVGRTYFADDLPSLLGEEYSATVKKNALSSLKETLRLSPIGWLLLQGECEVKGKTVATITKGSWYDAEPIVILYSLYKFAERMDGM